MIPIISPTRQLDSTGLEEAFYRLYRDFFDQAERKRRWSIRDDIPWDSVNPRMSPAVADVVESFCAVELYLPDYITKALALPLIRASRGRAWFHANWGYEEAKHSLALGDWLLRSGMRTEQQMADLEGQVFDHEWNLPRDSPLGMVLYGMAQELATWVNYRNLRRRVDEVGDPALSRILGYITVDERSHHDFYKRIALLYLERDRTGTLEELRKVLHTFAMPALHLLADSRQRYAAINSLDIFSEEIFFRDVLRPILAALGVDWSEFRQRDPARKSWTPSTSL
jgi:acyl-[acyl-carrier-protein] desaturase